MCINKLKVLLINGCQFLFLIVLLFLLLSRVGAQNQDTLYILMPAENSSHLLHTEDLHSRYLSEIKPAHRESRRIVAALLCLALGPFGVHRLYLGTQPQVPAAYSITLGGGLGFIPLIDFFVIVFTKDLNKFRNNPKVIMWAE